MVVLQFCFHLCNLEFAMTITMARIALWYSNNDITDIIQIIILFQSYDDMTFMSLFHKDKDADYSYRFLTCTCLPMLFSLFKTDVQDMGSNYWFQGWRFWLGGWLTTETCLIFSWAENQDRLSVAIYCPISYPFNPPFLSITTKDGKAN